ncbi:MAG: Ig domain-containing protein [Ignavibacteriaceae bacterium]
MKDYTKQNILSVLMVIFILFAFFGCSKDQPTEPNSASGFVVPGQTVTGMIVHTTNGGSLFYVNNETLLARGGSPLSGYSWSVDNLSAMPAGTIVNPLTGIFQSSGGTLVAGTHKFTMKVSDGSKTATGNFTFVMNEYQGFGPLAVFQQPMGMFNIYLPDANTGSGYGASLWALGDGELPWSWYLGSGELPPGLTIDQANGVVRGTPNSSAAGNSYTFTVTVKDKNGETAINDGLSYHIDVPK